MVRGLDAAVAGPFSNSRDITHEWRHIEDSTGTGGHGFLFSVHSSTGFCSSATSFIGFQKKNNNNNKIIPF